MNKIIRCAIYTRKSTEEGLDMEFNSLDAQREAGEAYVKSQKHEGWELIPSKYDDGGYSGGNIERPGLKKLMSAIEAGKVDVVVVYKVDRLSRSLSDFAKLVEIFDKQKVSFVSVTQQFNTTTSMGRLTLNILLSFAQFEREVTGERIRDKFRASKEKGMWMGGFPQLGYDIENRNLVINEAEAEQVKYIFAEYLKLKSVAVLAKKLGKQGYKNKSWISRTGKSRGGQALTERILHMMLCNQMYIGKIEHKNKNKVYDGQHQAIISQKMWAEVQAELKNNMRAKKSGVYGRLNYLLRGKCFDVDDKLYTATYTSRQRSRYEYYINNRTGHRISTSELEKIVIQLIQVSLTHEEVWLKFIDGSAKILLKQQILFKLQRMMWNYDCLAKSKKLEIRDELIEKVIIFKDNITVKLSSAGINKLVDNFDTNAHSKPSEIGHSRPELEIAGEFLEISLPVHFENTGKKKQAIDGSGKPVKVFAETNYDMTLIKALVKSYRWNKMLESGEATSIAEIAELEGIDRWRVSKIINLITLSPEIITAILNGEQNIKLKTHHLLQPFPENWVRQKSIMMI